MTKYNFTRVLDRTDASSAKNDQNLVKQFLGLNYYDDTIPLWVADMDFECAPAISRALESRAKQGTLGYTMLTSAYQESIINWYGRRHNMKIEPEWIVFSNGTVSAIRNVIRAFTNEGDGVIIQPPVYYPFEVQVKDTNRKVIHNHLIRDDANTYSIDIADFEKKCQDPNNKLFIYCNPHNPTGNIWPEEVTQQLLTICAENDVLFFSDEIHADLLRAGKSFTSALNLEHSDKTIIATAVNKTFNVAGLHITNLVISNDELKQKLNKYTGSIGMSPFSLDATIAAYNEEEEWVTEVNQVIDTNLEMMREFIAAHIPKIRFSVPDATYLAWLDFSAFGIEEKELMELIANEAHLILERGSLFGEHGNGFIRINVACPTEILKEALERLEKLLNSM
ncbi:MalY/PatB family protein [Vibrio maerlii]|uniref:MalY/PatB family protein n=1 Tax=Vibrio maerlii TaxID=2231648 RepID=UPI000E3C8BE0|nr:PatB family C-S lyase [Vibrio maerlii]